MVSVWTEPRKQVTWVPGATYLYDLGHIPYLSEQQFSHVNNGELDQVLQIPAGNESNPEVHALVASI